MKVWRTVLENDGSYGLREVEDWRLLKPGKPIVFVCPGAGARTKNQKSHPNAAKTARWADEIMGADKASNDVETLVVTYDTATIPPKRFWLNLAMDRYHDRDAMQFCDEFLLPLLTEIPAEQRGSISCFCLSQGTVFIESVRACLIKRCHEIGITEEKKIQALADQVFSLCVSNISRSADPAAPHRDNRINFPTAFLALRRDFTAMTENQSYRYTIPVRHVRGQLSISHISNNRIQITADAPEVLYLNRRNDDRIRQNKHRIPGVRWNHEPTFLLDTGSPEIGTAPIAERLLRHAVGRDTSTPINIMAMLTTPSHPISARGNIRDEQREPDAITDARIQDALTRGELPSHHKAAIVSTMSKLFERGMSRWRDAHPHVLGTGTSPDQSLPDKPQRPHHLTPSKPFGF